MTERFARVAENDLLVRGSGAFQELRFNGDREAFVRADFDDFYSLLLSDHVLWLSDKVAACTDPLADDSLLLMALFERSGEEGISIYHFNFDNVSFRVICLREPTVDETPLFDMLLESQGRVHTVREFSIRSEQEECPIPFPFSSDALEKFLNGNEQLRSLDIQNLELSSNVSDIIGRAPLNLKRLELTCCDLDMQRFVNVLERNVGGPKEIKLTYCSSDETGKDFALSHSAMLVPLLNCKLMKSLYIEDFASTTL
jgi:hypothetical protein